MSDSSSPTPNLLAEAASALQAGRLDEADRLFERACIGPSSAECFNGRGTVAAARNDFSAATAHFERACAIEPGNAIFQYQRGVALIATGRIEPATTAFEQSVKLDPGFAQGWFNLGSARSHARNIEGAIEAFRRATEGDRGIEHARLAIVDALRSSGAIDDAIQAARDAISRRPEWAEAWARLGLCLADKQDLETAIACWDRAVELEQKLEEPRLHMGIAQGMLGRREQAAATYERLLQLKPGHVKATVNLAGILMSQGELAEAERRLAATASIQGPDRPMALIALGDLRMQQVRVPDAERCYREAARFAPGEPRARIGLVACLIEQERNEEGLAESERLARDFPQLPASAECFAEALVANGRGELALGVIDPCISRHGASPWRHGLRGRACESIGDQAGALAAFEAALAMDPNFELAIEGRRRVAGN